MSFMLIINLLINLVIPIVICQIDLGSFSLGQNRHGDLKFIFNQAANIMGFGGDRGLDLTVGEGRFNTRARHGILISGERIGADSNIAVNEAEGLDFRNLLNFGSNSVSFNNPAGQFLSFLERIMNFFTTTNKPLDFIPSFPQYGNPDVKTGSVFRSFEELKRQKISGETMNHMQPENVDYDDYYHDVEVEDEAAQRQFKMTSASFDQKNWITLHQSIVGTEFNATTI